MVTTEIPDIVIGRLPIYLRELRQLAREEKQLTTSSHELGRRLGISSAQIRKDLSHFGEFGKQGTGYHIKYLIEQLQQILHLTQEWPVALIGAGYLGHAIAHYNGFQHRGFRIAWVFDNDPAKIGVEMNGLTVQSIDELEETIQQNHTKIAIIVVPANVAQKITDRLVTAGVESILSYAPINLKVPNHVHVSYSDPVVQMQQMTYYLQPPNSR
ncbi:MAG: redox-sensing transcriptional repressor Rex [Ardenticatenaceae bacterium]|nr:redox-sensing transcriptional repressor Rex [Ardenticatenaceae bacterium]MCB9443248.1 redox-sensing transcriptional repressor Rex [Ardenticatenaceae bacterium]